mgnify:CR=1 FL=1
MQFKDFVVSGQVLVVSGQVLVLPGEISRVCVVTERTHIVKAKRKESRRGEASKAELCVSRQRPDSWSMSK